MYQLTFVTIVTLSAVQNTLACPDYKLSGVAIDSADKKDVAVIKKKGKVLLLEQEIKDSKHIPLIFVRNP